MTREQLLDTLSRNSRRISLNNTANSLLIKKLTSLKPNSPSSWFTTSSRRSSPISPKTSNTSLERILRTSGSITLGRLRTLNFTRNFARSRRLSPRNRTSIYIPYHSPSTARRPSFIPIDSSVFLLLLSLIIPHAQICHTTESNQRISQFPPSGLVPSNEYDQRD